MRSDDEKGIKESCRIQQAMEDDSRAAISLRQTDDFKGIRSLALRAGLEDGKFDDIVAAYGCYSGHGLVGCAALKRVGDTFSIEWLAVEGSHRRKGIGRAIVGRVASEAKGRGATQLWALARAPDFFMRLGFLQSSPEVSPGPNLAGCAKCAQYQVSCFPKIVVKDL